MSNQPTISYLTLAGSIYGDAPKYCALDRAKAAHAVGLTNIGLSLSDTLDPGITHYVSTPEAEWLDLSKVITPRETNRLRTLVTDFGVTRVNVGVCEHNVLWWEAARNLEPLVAVTHDLGITIAIEPVAFGSFRTLADIRQILTQAGNPSHVGLLYDVWQVNAGMGSLIRPRMPVSEIQLSGIPRYPHPIWQDKPASQDRPTLARSAELVSDAVMRLPAGTPVSYEVPREPWRSMPLIAVAEAVAKDLADVGYPMYRPINMTAYQRRASGQGF